MSAESYQPVAIRPYMPSDRDAIRRICFDTGFMGGSASFYWRDFPSFADIWTSYYTDQEPESTFVAEREGRVVGYLTGCVDTARSVSPRDAIIRQMRARWLLLRPGTAGFFWRSIWEALRQRSLASGDLDDPRWPSHLHIDLLSEARGLGAGRRLMEAWLARLREVGSPGCHLGTLAENTGGIAFFCRMGFTPHGPPVLIPGQRTPSGARVHSLTMVQSLGESTQE